MAGALVLNGLDLFSGIGGLSLALSPWVKTIAYCENDRYCQSVLLSRMRSGDISTAPIWDDVTNLLPEMLPGHEIDIIIAGFPCQDISVSGSRKGLAGKRSGLFFEVIRLVRELRPKFVFLENVTGIFTGDNIGVIAAALTDLRYDCRWGVLSAADVGAPHRRERWFALAHAKSVGRRQGDQDTCGNSERKKAQEKWSGPSDFLGWQAQPIVSRVDDGAAFRVDRLRGLGNAVVPQQAREAFERLIGFK